MKPRTLVQAFACYLSALRHCDAKFRDDWRNTWASRIRALETQLPSGSGFDVKVTLDQTLASSDAKLTFVGSFHRMNSHGFYVGWCDFRVIVRPEFDGFSVRVAGTMPRSLREYIAETFQETLSTEANEHE